MESAVLNGVRPGRIIVDGGLELSKLQILYRRAVVTIDIVEAQGRGADVSDRVPTRKQLAGGWVIEGSEDGRRRGTGRGYSAGKSQCPITPVFQNGFRVYDCR